jgi:ribonuclease R
MTEQQLEQAILELVAQKSYRPVKPRKIAKQLGLDEEQVRQLKKTVKRLVAAGRLAYGQNHAVGLPGAATGNRIVGVFRRMQDGYGFVRPAGSLRKDKDDDIYIAPNAAGDASTGDTVLVEVSSRRGGRGGRLKNGKIVEVVERDTHRFVGTYFEQAGYGMVQVDGTVFTQPVAVGDAGAKNVSPDDKVVIEMVRFPSQTHDAEAVIVEVLGRRGDPGVDTLSIIHEFGLPGPFAEDALEDARERAEGFDESIGPERRDLTAETVITIDPVDARDFDDAISLEQIENGHWRLGVHIADVSHFVKEKTALDREARDRATSVYLPDRVIPMLPEIISNNLASLQPDRVRYTKTVFIEFTADGARVAVDACTAAIRSKRRFTYEEVDDYLADPAKWHEKLTPAVHALLGRMHKLAMMLRHRRFDRGSLELTMPELKVDLDKNGHVSGAHLVENTESHQIIEEFMLAANEAVAGLLSEAELIFLRRIHEDPDPRKLKLLTEFVRELGFDVESLESRFELQGLLNRVAGEPQQHAVNYAVLRSMQKAIYSPVDEGHYALASDCYCHFTSPIRRYPDLTVHRLLDCLFQKQTPKQQFDEVAMLGTHCSDREQRAEKAERELTKVKLLNYLSERIGHELEGVVTGVMEFGFFVEGIELPAEGLVHVSSLQDDYYHYDRAAHTLTGNRQGNQWRLGDFVRVAVARVDVDRRELDFRLVRRLKGSHDSPQPRKGPQRNQRSPSRTKNAAKGKSRKQGSAKPAKKKKRGKT